MPKQLYEEALADVKKVKELAEANAQRKFLEVVTPRIRDLIERELLGEHGVEDADDFAPPGAPPAEGELMTDRSVAPSADASPADAISMPDAEGKVTLDLDALASDPAGDAVEQPMMGKPAEFELGMESVDPLSKLVSGTKFASRKKLDSSLADVKRQLENFTGASPIIRASQAYGAKIAQMISHVEDMYDYVQESMSDPAIKSAYETQLEAQFKQLNKLQEQTMSKKKMMNEEDVTLKLTGLPDDLDLDSVGVDLITGDEEGGEDDLGMGDDEMAPEGGDESGDLDLDGLGGDEGGSDDELPMESLNLSDDTVVEIDENMLRREIARMRKLREEAAPTADGHGVNAAVLDDFGGGSDEGEPLDADMPDKSPAKAALPLGEADGEDLDELDELDELDGMGEDATCVEADAPPVAAESYARRAAFEDRLQARARSRVKALKVEAAKAARRGDARAIKTLKNEYANVKRRFTESVARAEKLKKLQSESRSNSASTRSAESNTVKTLRSKLAETNLSNAKLLFTNKLLQNESLTARQKASVIEQLDAAKTVREARLVYESLSKTLAGKQVNESRDRKVMGSSSRATRSASAQSTALNEGYETERWAKIAGLVK